MKKEKNMKTETIISHTKIGIIGGVGPYAGLDLNKKIFDNTNYSQDQDHLEIVLYSASNKITDRTEYLLSPQLIKNPALAIADIVEELHQLGVTLLAIPCNTFHAKPIFKIFEKKLQEKNLNVEVVHLIENAFDSMKKEKALLTLDTLGLLATKGTYESKVYEEIAYEKGVKLLIPSPKEREDIHEAIYHQNYGIKAQSNPVTTRATEVMKTNSLKLIKRGAEAIILGCTEIPLALDKVPLKVPKIDPTSLLARSLIRKVNPSKLAKCSFS